MLDAWSSALAELTREHREMRAAELAREGRARRAGWKEHVEESTAEARTRAQLDGEHATLYAPMPTMGSAGAWHFQRARGQRERFERVADCQQVTAVEIKCEACGSAVLRGARCRTALVCVSCRGKIQHEKRARLLVNRRAAIQLCHDAGLFFRKRRGGRWSEKLVTLTVPFFAELGVTARIRFTQEIWRHFAAGWNRYLELHEDVSRYADKQGNLLARWYRSLEWTTGESCATCTHSSHRHKGEDARAGSGPCASSGCGCVRFVERTDEDERGHPHVHLWYLGPYLPGARAEDDKRSNVVRNLWRNAIRLASFGFPELAGKIGPRRFTRARGAVSCEGSRGSHVKLEPWEWREMDGLDHVVVDVRGCAPGAGSAEEVVKYIFKDVVAGGRRLPVETWAAVYEGFDGMRTTQGSRGLMTLAVRERLMKGFFADPLTGELTPVDVAALREARLDSDLRRELPTGCACRCGERGAWRVRRRMMTEEDRQAIHARRPLRKGAAPRRGAETTAAPKAAASA